MDKTEKGFKKTLIVCDSMEKLRSESWASSWCNGTTMRTNFFRPNPSSCRFSNSCPLTSSATLVFFFAFSKYSKFTRNFHAHLTFEYRNFKTHNRVWQSKILVLLNYWRKADVIAWIIYGDVTAAVICNSLTFCFSALSTLIGSSNDTLFYIKECDGEGSTSIKIPSKIC